MGKIILEFDGIEEQEEAKITDLEMMMNTHVVVLVRTVLTLLHGVTSALA